jgi:hypothetical protein
MSFNEAELVELENEIQQGNSIEELIDRQNRGIKILEDINNTYISDMSVEIINLRNRAKMFAYYENWTKVILPKTSGIIKESEIKTKKYPNSSNRDIENSNFNKNLYEDRFYLGLSTNYDFVLDDMVIARADTPDTFTEFWHLHTNTDEIVTCFGNYDVIHGESENPTVNSFVKNDLILVKKGTRHSMQNTSGKMASNFCVKTKEQMLDGDKNESSYSVGECIQRLPLSKDSSGNWVTSRKYDLKLPYYIDSISLDQGENLSITTQTQRILWIVRGEANVEPHFPQEFRSSGCVERGDAIILDSNSGIEIKANCPDTVIFSVTRLITNET